MLPQTAAIFPDWHPPEVAAGQDVESLTDESDLDRLAQADRHIQSAQRDPPRHPMEEVEQQDHRDHGRERDWARRRERAHNLERIDDDDQDGHGDEAYEDDPVSAEGCEQRPGPHGFLERAIARSVLIHTSAGHRPLAWPSSRSKPAGWYTASSPARK